MGIILPQCYHLRKTETGGGASARCRKVKGTWDRTWGKEANAVCMRYSFLQGEGTTFMPNSDKVRSKSQEHKKCFLPNNQSQ